MAKKRNKAAQSPQAYIEGMVDLINAMSNIRSGGNGGMIHGPQVAGVAPLLDPSTNVKELVELRAQYEDKIRTLDAGWQQRFDTERQRANVASAEKESLRVDARFAELSTQALTLVNTVAATAKAAQDAVQAAAVQQTEAMNQMREIVSTLGTTVTSLVAGGGATSLAQREQRGDTQFATSQRARTSQWAIGLAIFGGISFLGLILSATIFVSTHIVVK